MDPRSALLHKIGGFWYLWCGPYGIAGGTSLRLRSQSGFDGSVTNISVKEIGQWWSANQGWEIGDGVANRTATNADFLLSETGTPTIGATYKVSFKMTSYTTGTNYLSFAGSYLVFSQSAVGDYSYNIVVIIRYM